VGGEKSGSWDVLGALRGGSCRGGAVTAGSGKKKEGRKGGKGGEGDEGKGGEVCQVGCVLQHDAVG